MIARQIILLAFHDPDAREVSVGASVDPARLEGWL
jgi:hypothetical protein